MELFLVLFAAGGVAVVAQVVSRRRKASRDEVLAELAGVRRLAEEDVVLFGEELMRLVADYQSRAGSTAETANERVDEVAPELAARRAATAPRPDDDQPDDAPDDDAPDEGER